MECDICGDDLSKAGPLGKVTCQKCGLTPMCEKCSEIHKFENKCVLGAG
jgi:hypothetical protein